MKRLLNILFASALILFGIAPAAYAHTALVSSNPAAGSTVAELPESITLTFANPLLTLGATSVNQVEVIDPMGAVITSKENVVKGAVLSNVLAPTMVMSGSYQVTFRVAAQDGHILNGNFSFSVGASSSHSSISVPKSGIVSLHTYANGKGVLDGVGSPTESAVGDFTIDFSKFTLCYSIKTAINDVTAIHIHAASQKNLTISDEIFLPLALASLNSAQPICQKEPGNSLATLSTNASSYVFMLHTKKFPDGAVAGLLQRVNSNAPLISSATATAASSGGNSALVLTIANNSPTNILINSVSSPLANSSMIFYDSNMCAGNSMMKSLPNISLAPGQVQHLGYQFQGAMLAGLKSAIHRGQSIPLVITYGDGGANTHPLTVSATVVKPPKGLHFAMSGMGA